jgi:hypothetical protein
MDGRDETAMTTHSALIPARVLLASRRREPHARPPHRCESDEPWCPALSTSRSKPTLGVAGDSALDIAFRDTSRAEIRGRSCFRPKRGSEPRAAGPEESQPRRCPRRQSLRSATASGARRALAGRSIRPFGKPAPLSLLRPSRRSRGALASLARWTNGSSAADLDRLTRTPHFLAERESATSATTGC